MTHPHLDAPARPPLGARSRFLLPSVMLGGAALLLLVSMFLPYWRLGIEVPGAARRLEIAAYLGGVRGDLAEVESLNRYIGMRPVSEAAELERSLSTALIVVLALLLVAAMWVRNRFAALLALPAVLFPASVVADLSYWLRELGTRLDPAAPLAGTVEPFVPPLFGHAQVAQFSTVAWAGPGLWLAGAASLLVLGGLFCQRRAALAGGEPIDRI